MPQHRIVPHEEWVAARIRHLAPGKEFTRQRDELSRERRELPREKVEKEGVRAARSGPTTSTAQSSI